MWILLIALQSGNGLTAHSVEFDTHKACEDARKVYFKELDDKLSLSINIVLNCVPKGENK